MKVTYTYRDTLQVITKLCSEIILKRKETSSLAVVSKPGQESVGRKTQAATSEYTPAVDFKNKLYLVKWKNVPLLPQTFKYSKNMPFSYNCCI